MLSQFTVVRRNMISLVDPVSSQLFGARHEATLGALAHTIRHGVVSPKVRGMAGEVGHDVAAEHGKDSVVGCPMLMMR